MIEEGTAHPHDLRAGVPHRLPSAVVRELSRIEPWRALSALAVEWAAIAIAIVVAEQLGPVAWPFAVVFIGARQAALTVIAHDAAHYRLLPGRRWNDAVGNVLADWPTFITLGAFRKHHGEHHQHLGEPGDGNRFVWRTHDARGALHPDWVYPKSPLAFVRKLALKAAGPTGLWWMVRGTLAALVFRGSWGELSARIAYTVGIALLLTAADAWLGFLMYWVVPFCTWHMVAQYVRLVCEHSAVVSDGPPVWGLTRTTLARPWERWLLVPRNIHYHIEHHFYPSVPFYNLPVLHRALMAQPGWRDHAVVSPSVLASLRSVLA